MTNISSQLYSSWVWCVCGGGGVSLGEAIPDDVKTCPECFCDYTYQQNEERSYFWCVWKQIGKSRRTKINLLKVYTGMCIYRLFERDKGKVCMYVLLKLYLIHVNNSPSSAPPSHSYLRAKAAKIHLKLWVCLPNSFLVVSCSHIQVSLPSAVVRGFASLGLLIVMSGLRTFPIFLCMQISDTRAKPISPHIHASKKWCPRSDGSRGNLTYHLGPSLQLTNKEIVVQRRDRT